ncbi:MAG: zinc-ribbon domain-containing protein [Candidatus Cryptobacteroides sp.]
MRVCPNCNAPVEPDHLFCTECGYRLEEEKPAAQAATEAPAAAVEQQQEDDIINVENHIMWNVQPGQVARLIPEKEFSRYSDAAGIIVNDGARVLIRKNASEYVMLSSGIYSFKPEAPETEVQEDKKKNRFLRNLISASGQVAETSEKDIFSILIVRDGTIPVIFGGPQSTDEKFVPMVIPAKNLDIEVGVSANLRISCMQEFVSSWMLDRTHITNAELSEKLSSKVEKVLREILSDVIVSENGIPDTVCSEIRDRLMCMTDSLGGISFASVEEIRVGNEALERFRALNSELYLTGRELEYLERTNEFKNRLAAAQNAQQVDEARNDLLLMRALQQINEDKLLAEDELEKFYMVLSREKKIREAQNQEQIDAALADIERTGLVRAEDLNRLKDEIRSDEHRRGHAFRMMQKRDELELESLQREFDKRMRDEDYEFEKRKKDDEFDRFKELEKMRREKEAEEHERSMEALREMQRAKLEKLKLSKDLTPEQLMALAANENLSSEAATRFAESLGRGRDVEAERRHQEEIDRLMQARIEDMKDMSKTEHETVRELIRSMAPNQAAQQAQATQQPVGGSGFKFCPKCGNKCESAAKFCMNCGNPFN